MSVLKFAGSVFAVAVAAASFGSTASADQPVLIVGDGSPISILNVSGLSYTAAVGGATSTLNVNSGDFLLCANVYAGTSPVGGVRFVPGHPNWTMPATVDVRNVSYNGGVLSVNASVADSSLTCQARSADGKVGTAFSGHGNMLFDDSFEASIAVQFESQINWRPVAGFDWLAADWTVVPNDSCAWDMNTNLPQLAESTLCAAAAGVRPVAAGSQNDARYGDRAATMWTKTSLGKFTYLARIDTRFGTQQGTPNSSFVPTPPPTLPNSTSSSVDFAIRDGFDSSYLSASGTYCLLKALPAVLDENVCSDASVYFSGSLSGNLSERVTLDDAWIKSKSLYVAVVRNWTTIFSGANTPVAAIATISDPGVSRYEGGDEFTGDNVVFGFPEGQHFQWMPAGTR